MQVGVRCVALSLDSSYLRQALLMTQRKGTFQVYGDTTFTNRLLDE